MDSLFANLPKVSTKKSAIVYYIKCAICLRHCELFAAGKMAKKLAVGIRVTEQLSPEKDYKSYDNSDNE